MASSEDRHDAGGQAKAPVAPSAAEATTSEGADILILDAGGAPDPISEETVLLELEDLLPDASGEVVLFATDELPVNIVTDEPVTRAGIAEAHVTATGVDVTGLHFYSFEGGLTLYSPIDLLIVTEPGVG